MARRLSSVTAAERLTRSQSIESIIRNLDYIRVNGVPGVLLSDCAKVTRSLDLNGNGGGDDNKNNNDTNPDKGHIQELGYDGGGSGVGGVWIKLPYAGTSLTIHLLFYTSEPWIAPEMTFGDDHFSSVITLKDLIEQVPSLNEWNIDSSDMVAQLVHQVLQLFRRYQLDRLDEDDLQIQYQSLLKTLKIGDEDIEIIVNSADQFNTSSSSSSSSFLLRLPLNLQDAPPVLIDSNPGAPVILLQLDFPRREGGNRVEFVPKLHLSSRIESLLGQEYGMVLPVVSPGIGLMDYVNTLMTLMEDKFRKTILSFESRKQFIIEMLCHFGRAVIEYDIEYFKRVVLMLEVKDFHFLVFITLGPNFPQISGPRVLFQSLYHFNDSQPVSQELTDLHYNPQWKPEKMVQQIKDGIFSSISSFQLKSIRTNMM